jgi:PhnB protein
MSREILLSTLERPSSWVRRAARPLSADAQRVPFAEVDGAAEAERIWALLSKGGQILMPMEETFFAIRFGQLRDKFGISWMILALKPQTR